MKRLLNQLTLRQSVRLRVQPELIKVVSDHKQVGWKVLQGTGGGALNYLES